MPYIRTVPPSQATGKVKEIYESGAGPSAAPPEKIQELLALIERGCHTINSLKTPVPVSGRLFHNGREVALTA